MKDNKDWRISLSHEIRENMPPEALAHVITEMQTTLVTGGIDALLAVSQEVISVTTAGVEDGSDRCMACGGRLQPEPGWDDEYECIVKSMPECKHYAYISLDSEAGVRLMEAAKEIERNHP
jgi:hypothetical protein